MSPELLPGGNERTLSLLGKIGMGVRRFLRPEAAEPNEHPLSNREKIQIITDWVRQDEKNRIEAQIKRLQHGQPDSDIYPE